MSGLYGNSKILITSS